MEGAAAGVLLILGHALSEYHLLSETSTHLVSFTIIDLTEIRIEVLNLTTIPLLVR